MKRWNTGQEQAVTGSSSQSPNMPDMAQLFAKSRGSYDMTEQAAVRSDKFLPEKAKEWDRFQLAGVETGDSVPRATWGSGTYHSHSAATSKEPNKACSSAC